MKQLITYFGLAYLISWTIWLPFYGHTFGLTNLPTLPYHHGLGGLGPLIASFLTTWIFQRKEGINLLIKKCLQVRPLFYLTVALLSPFLLAFIATIINFFIDKSPINLSGLLSCKEFSQFNLLTFFIYNLIFFGFGEEVGWRGFALPRFHEKFNALINKHNPVFIPRNHLVEQALNEAANGNMNYFVELLNILSKPFQYQENSEKYMKPASSDFESRYQTFCGT